MSAPNPLEPTPHKRPTVWIVLGVAQQRAAKAATPAPTTAPAEVDSAIQQQFEQSVGDLGATNASVDQIQQNVKTAQQERDDAKGALNTAEAGAAAVRARIELTRSCLSGTLNAVSSAFKSGGVDAAKQQLQTIADNCKSVAAS